MVLLISGRILATLLLVVFTRGENSILSDNLSRVYGLLQREGFRRERPWSEFSSRGPLSALAADFHNGPECWRVVVFQVEGVMLHHIRTLCDGLEPTMDLIVVNNTLYFKNRAMVKDLGGNQFTVMEEMIARRQCTKWTFAILPGSTVVQRKPGRQVDINQDNDCATLMNFNMPEMTLLSTNRRIGKYIPKPRTSWSSYNPWEELGAVTRLYGFGRRCFRLVVITSYGRSVAGMKVTCGAIQGLVVDRDTLYYADAVKVRRMTGDVFSLLFNLKKGGTCTKKTISLVKSRGLSSPRTVSTQILDKDDVECANFIQVANTRRRQEEIITTDLTEKLANNIFHVNSEDRINMTEYTLFSKWNTLNLPMGLGLAVGAFNKTDHTFHRGVAVMARGGLVALTAVMIDAKPAQRLVMRVDHLYYDTHIMAKKLPDGETYRVLFRVGEDHCITKEFSVKDINGKVIKQDWSSEKRSKTDDVECKNLIERNSLKTTKFAEIGGQTDDVGVPTVLPEDDDSTEQSPEQNNQAGDLDKASPLKTEEKETRVEDLDTPSPTEEKEAQLSQTGDLNKSSPLIADEEETDLEDVFGSSGASMSNFSTLSYIIILLYCLSLYYNSRLIIY